MGKYVFFHPGGREPEHDDFILWRLSEFLQKWGYAQTLGWIGRLHDRGFSHLLMIATPSDLSPEFVGSEGETHISAYQLNSLISSGAKLCIAPSSSDEFHSPEHAMAFLSQLNPPRLGTDPATVQGLPYSLTSTLADSDLDALIQDLRSFGTHST